MEKAHELALKIYAITKKFQKEELYGLINQVSRSSVSIASNIVEEGGRFSNNEFVRFLYIAFGSANEVEYQLLLSKDLKYLNETDHEELTNNVAEIKKMINGLLKKIKSSN